MKKTKKISSKKYMAVFLLSFFLFSVVIPATTVHANCSNLVVDLFVKDGQNWVENREAPVGTELEFKADVIGITGDVIAMAALPKILDFITANPSPDEITENPDGKTLLIWYRDSSNERLTFYFKAVIIRTETDVVQFMALVLPASSAKDEITVTGIISDNQKPNTPSKPNGPQSGITGVAYSYETVASDPDGDAVSYGWDWNGDSSVDDWTAFYPSGQEIESYYTWEKKGTYQIKVIAKDDHGLESDWSYQLTIIIDTPPSNTQPNKPTIPSGPSSGTVGMSYKYSSSTIDPDGDDVLYWFNWGDGTSSGWLGPYHSGNVCEVEHVWSVNNYYNITVKAKDIHEKESVWSDPLPIIMPYRFSPFQQFCEWLFNHFPHGFPILRHLLQNVESLSLSFLFF